MARKISPAALEGRPSKMAGKGDGVTEGSVAADGIFPSSELNKPISWESKVPPPINKALLMDY